MALMWLAARWARETGWPGKLLVGVVDHGLRPEAADEAKLVQREARKLGLKPHVLKWTGPHPRTGIPAAAREARYELLFGLAGKCGAIVLTAHTQADQAETLLMRLARGSGVDGLAGMDIHSMRNGIELLRPLLGVSRERLRATLREAGLSWIDDPTNENTAHERVRVRKALGVLEGLGLTREAIALSARRLGRARAALEVATGGLMQVAVRIEANSYAEIELERWLHGPAELQVRSIMELARLFGGGQEISLSGAERVRDWMTGERSRATTFAGCRFARRDKVIIAGREPARVDPVPVAMCGAGSRSVVWDNRYEIAVAARLLPAEVLPAAGVKELERPRGIPDFVWRGLPVVKTAGGELFAPVECAGAGQGPVFRLIQAPMQVRRQAGT
jgi:tRNA(Ile)-lysidine synthase